MTVAALKIDIYTEITCPWCLIGVRRLDNVLSRDFAGLETDIEHHPVILMPGVPDTGIAMVPLLRQRYGITDPAMAWERPEAEARSAGIKLSLATQPTVFPTDRAHVLIRHARALGTQHRLAVALSEANFLHARNIADPDVLVEIAQGHGFSEKATRALVENPREREAVHAESDVARRRGINSVPHFVLDGRTELQGTPEPELAAAIRSVLAQHALLPRAG